MADEYRMVDAEPTEERGAEVTEGHEVAPGPSLRLLDAKLDALLELQGVDPAHVGREA